MHLPKKLTGGDGLIFERSDSKEAFLNGLAAVEKGKGPDDCPEKFKYAEDSWQRGFATGIQICMHPTGEAAAYNGG